MSAAYSAGVLATGGLVSYWRVGETSGTSAADSKGSNTGTYTGAPTLGSAGLITADSDTAVSLVAASRQYISVPDSSTLDLGDVFTLEAWVKPTAYRDSSGLAGGILDKGSNAFIVRFADALDGTFILRRNGVSTLVTSTARIPLNVVSHVVVTKNGSTVKLYLNGVDVTGTVTNATMTNTALPLTIGAADSGTDNFFSGVLDEVAVYSVALGASTVLDHYQRGIGLTLGGPSGTAAATLSLTAPTSLALGGIGGVGGPTLGLAARTALVVASIPGSGGVTLAVTAPTRVPLGTIAGVGSATVTLGGSVAIPIASIVGQGRITLALRAPVLVAPGGAAGQGAAALSLTAPTKLALAAIAGIGGATGAIASPTSLAIGAVTGVGTVAGTITCAVAFVAVASPVRLSIAEAIMQSHTIAVQATLLSDGVAVLDLPVLDGSVTLDANAAIRGRLDLAVAIGDDTLNLVPAAASSSLAPYGNEVQVSRGVLHPDGVAELVALGIFRLDSVDIDDSPGSLSLRIGGNDRAARVIDARFEEPFQIAQGTNYGTAILTVLQGGYPDVVYDFAATSLTTPQILAEEGGDRWALAQSMATAIGMELFFDGAGILILRPVPTPVSGSPAWYLVEGEDGVLLRAGRSWNRQGAYNRYIVTGESTGSDDPPARGIATDNNPLSPTYYYGRFGRVPGFFVSSLVTTDAQAADAAAAMLARQLGTTQQASFGALVNPALAPGDIVRVRRLRAGIDEDNVIDTVTIPLTAAGEMTGSTRATQVVS